MSQMRTELTEINLAYLSPAEDLEIACPSCLHPMAIWNDARDVRIKTAHCVNCEHSFNVEEVRE